MYECGWIGRPYDCYVLYSRIENGPFRRIVHGDGLDLVVHSDDDEVDGHGEAESWQSDSLILEK